jgi:lambda repressor-like predicted transcriptional regulator
MQIAERTATWRRERRVLLRVSRGAWRLDQAERERSWALASARAEGVSIRALTAAAGLSSSRVHQIVAAADLEELDAALGELRAAAGRPRKTPMAVMTRNWTAGTSSRTGSSMRRAGFGQRLTCR